MLVTKVDVLVDIQGLRVENIGAIGTGPTCHTLLYGIDSKYVKLLFMVSQTFLLVIAVSSN